MGSAGVGDEPKKGTTGPTPAPSRDSDAYRRQQHAIQDSCDTQPLIKVALRLRNTLQPLIAANLQARRRVSRHPFPWRPVSDVVGKGVLFVPESDLYLSDRLVAGDRRTGRGGFVPRRRSFPRRLRRRNALMW